MNCVSCGNPSIKFKFLYENSKETLYFCKSTTCFYDFMPVFTAYFEKNANNNMIESVSKALKYLKEESCEKFFKKFGKEEIFCEELAEENLEKYYKNEKIIEFYVNSLNEKSLFSKEKLVIGPLTVKKMINDELFLQDYKEKLLFFRDILVIYREKTNVFSSFILRKRQNDDKKIGNSSINLKNMENSEKISSFFNENLLEKGYSLQKNDNFEKSGYFSCIIAEAFCKGEQTDFSEKNIKNLATEQELKEKINALIILS